MFKFHNGQVCSKVIHNSIIQEVNSSLNETQNVLTHFPLKMSVN